MFIIYHTRAYARKLARELRVTSYFPNQHVLSRRRGKMSAVVNWGCTNFQLPANVHIGEARILNADVRVSISKVATFDRLRAANLPIPRVVTDAHALIDDIPFYMRGKYLGRSDGLTGGAGITIYEKGQRPDTTRARHDFYSQVVSKAFEVRIHVAGGRVICEQFKFVPTGQGTLIRNFDNGARFSAEPLQTRIAPEIAERAREIAILAVAACGMDFGALDMALTKNGEWIIFEINSAPGLTEWEPGTTHQMISTYDAYRDYFQSFVV